ncbi:pheromone A receptor-domain-containing protein [Phialemonium atrogriseum]|uniref:Pheromone A receptor-domain-containing protein n=1 Tax=Phialemonium atrogriseum TaxID=1093897 RepID=A0AAJ0C7L8_9PEZI|nr:pheromone A receptor-domain-containing protein [Phialemonium atrogriseum]KAK1769176.1 pheromone A receptor-domain-containing protein [Phialemonium atrogriseum]
MSGFTTTPDERIGPGPPYSNPSLEANLFFRVCLGILAPIACWVPMRLLWRNGEFSAAAFCIVTMILNFYYVVNALLWRDNNVQNWFAGYGWCDLQVYTIFALETVYSASVFSIMRNLANRVGLMRATSLTSKEKKRRNLVEGLVLLPAALVQIIVTYLVLAQRYNVSTLIGCTSAYDTSWPFLVFFDLPSPIYAVGAAVYAVLTWKRFREVAKSTHVAMNTNNSIMVQRHHRVRRKLYLMALSILIPFVPIQLLFLYYNLLALNLPLKPYDFKQIHYGNNPYPFNFISFSTSDTIGFIELNRNYVAIITVVPIFWFFGLTKEAINTYRQYLLALGLGTLFPNLNEEYDPDRAGRSSLFHCRRSIEKVLKSSLWTSSSRSLKGPVLPTAHHISVASPSTTTRRSSDAAPTISSPWPDVDTPSPPRAAATPATAHGIDDHVHELRTPPRNPFIFRTALSAPIRLPPLHIPAFFRKRTGDAAAEPSSPGTLLRPLSGPSEHRPETDGSAGPAWACGAEGARVHTRVWSAEDGSGVVGPVEKSGVRVETRIAKTVSNAV